MNLVWRIVGRFHALRARRARRAAVAAIRRATSLGTKAARLERAQLEPGRLQIHRLGRRTLLDDSYNSSPAAASAALETLAAFPRPHTAVLGDMLELGPDAAAYHERLGEQTLGLDRTVAVGPAMKSLLSGNPAAWHLESFDLGVLSALLPDRGTLLVKGSRGMRLERLVTHWLKDRRERAVKIDWQFTTPDARIKLKRLYPEMTS